MVIPEAKEGHLTQAYKDVDKVEKQRSSGLITAGERHNKIIDIWHQVTEDVAKEMFTQMSEIDLDSGIRTSLDGPDDIRAFTAGFVIRGFDIDEGVPVGLTRPVDEFVLDMESIDETH